MAEVVRRCEEPSLKSLDSDDNLKTLNTLFCRDIKVCPDFHTFWKSLAKKVLLGVKNSVSWARNALFNTWYIFHIILRYICNYAQKRRICRENSKYALDNFFMAIFVLAKRLPTSATPHECYVDGDCDTIVMFTNWIILVILVLLISDNIILDDSRIGFLLLLLWRPELALGSLLSLTFHVSTCFSH